MDKFYNKQCWIMTNYGLLFTFIIILSTEMTCLNAYPQQMRTSITVCPRDFIRLGGSCYHFSNTTATWDDAYFICKDKKSNLTAPERWEDRNIREYLNNVEIEKGDRWIGGLYDWNAKAWKWGGELRKMKYQSFSRMPRLPPEKLKWNCVAMIPDLLYRWSPRICLEKKFFICQTKLKKVYKSQNSAMNEIPLPDLDVDNEVNPNMSPNDAYTNDRNDNYENGRIIGKAEFAHRNRTNNSRIRRKKKPFPGYKKIKGDPEATYLHNVKALQSGKSGLSPAQIEKHLHRLERLRRKEEREKRRKELLRNERNRQRNRINKTEDLNVLSPNENIIKGRHILPNIDEPSYKEIRKQNEFKRFENVTQRTYTMNNQLSVLHPNTIVEVHEIVSKDK